MQHRPKPKPSKAVVTDPLALSRILFHIILSLKEKKTLDHNPTTCSLRFKKKEYKILTFLPRPRVGLQNGTSYSVRYVSKYTLYYTSIVL